MTFGRTLTALLLMPLFCVAQAGPPALGLPPLPIPADNPQSAVKVKLGDKLFKDKRFSMTGEVSCATCHDPDKAFTDSPLKTSEGIHKLRGTRNAPTIINAAFFERMFWDGREPTLERQATQPLINPIEMGLPENYAPLLALVRNDPEYQTLFKDAFGVSGNAVGLLQVSQAMAAFERTIISGNSPFDHWYFAGEKTAISESAQRGYKVYIGQGRCVSCHVISQNDALFTDNRFHNINVGFQRIGDDARRFAVAFSSSKQRGVKVDEAVLADAKSSELGRFAVNDAWTDLGAFKTPTLRNVERTAPYMHDGSLAKLEDVVEFYNKGGKVKDEDPVNDYQSGGIRPLKLDDKQKADLVEFLKTLTSPEFAVQQRADNQ